VRGDAVRFSATIPRPKFAASHADNAKVTTAMTTRCLSGRSSVTGFGHHLAPGGLGTPMGGTGGRPSLFKLNYRMVGLSESNRLGSRASNDHRVDEELNAGDARRM
jgi:hypothetical protein